MAACLILALRGLTAAADESLLQLRLAWGGGPARSWHGWVEVSEGRLEAVRPLGIEADVPGGLDLDEARVTIHPGAPRAYDGFDVAVYAPPDAKLRVRLTADPGAGSDSQKPTFEVPLSTLLREPYAATLDELKNRLLIRRVPGDRLRVAMQRDSLVFAPGEALSLEIRPHRLGAAPGSRVEIEWRLKAAAAGDRGPPLQRHTLTQAAGSDDRLEPVAIELAAPAAEGVYDLVVTASVRRLPGGFGLKQKLAERLVQLVVVEGQPPAPRDTAAEPENLFELDPTRPGWRDRFGSIRFLPGQPRKGPLSFGEIQTWDHPLGAMLQLAPAAGEEQTPWVAYPLPVKEPGRPHVLEVEYPNNVPQTLGISIVEPNAAGAVMPIGLDSGVHVPAEAANQPAGPARHRLVFWPRTREPYVLLTNRSGQRHAVFRQVRLSALAEPLVRQRPASPRGTRLVAGYLDRPLFCENFSAPETLDTWSGRSLDDWQSFYHGARRLMEYLHYTGYNGVILGVAADGSTIYPSDVLKPTPRYDTGAFFDSGQDPVRKDVLELLLRLADREGLRIVPAVHFETPLPELEALLRQGGPQTSGLVWVGPDGTSWRDQQRLQRTTGPYYNVLHPRVQQAMLHVVRELVDRYGRHPSMAGVAVVLSADSYAVLPGTAWGFDDQTIARFSKATGLAVPGEGPQRHAQRARFLSQGKPAEAWRAWRAGVLTDFYSQLAELVAARPGARLHLAPTSLLEHAALRRDLRPALPRRTSAPAALLQVGLDLPRLAQVPDTVLLRPQVITPAETALARTFYPELNELGELDRAFDTPQSGSLAFHPPLEAHLASFDAQSPFKQTYTWLVSQISPSQHTNRKRFVRSLAAMDPLVVADGGWMLPLGQEEALRGLLHVVRGLPAARFETLDQETQPVTIRWLKRGDRTYVYLVNDSRWQVEVDLSLETPAGCRFVSLDPQRTVDPPAPRGGQQQWQLTLEPYDLVGGWFDAPSVTIESARVAPREEVRLALEQRLEDLGTRTAVLQNPPPLNVLENPDFERPSEAGGAIPGWQLAARPGVAAHVEADDSRQGKQVVRLSSTGAVGSLASRPFLPPATGRISVSVWLRVGQDAPQPAVRLAIAGRLQEGEYYRYATLGAGVQTVPLSADWQQYIFQVNDLPLEGLSDLRVRFELLGQGEVFIDDVQVYDLFFRDSEQVELKKILVLAQRKLQLGQLSDCRRLLYGYWPSFLVEHVPLTVPQQPPAAVAAPPGDAQPPANEPPPQAEQSWFDRFKASLPRLPRF